MNKPNWAYWLNLADVELRQAVELSCDVEPGSLEHQAADTHVRADIEAAQSKIETRLSFARSHVTTRTLQVENRSRAISEFPYHDDEREFVRLADFRAWGESLHHQFDFPSEFPNTPPTDAPERVLESRERATLLNIIGALAKEAKIDLTEPYKAGEVVAKLLPDGVTLAARTIGDHLKKVRAAMDSRKV